jgi:hypothetical protein
LYETEKKCIHAKDDVHYLEFDNFVTFKTNIINQIEDFSKMEAIRKDGRQLIEAS